MRHPIIRTLLSAARKQKLDATHLAGTGKLDYSSSNRMLSGKSLRPSFDMIVGLAAATGFKLKTVRTRRPKLVKLKRPAAVKTKRKSTRRRKG